MLNAVVYVLSVAEDTENSYANYAHIYIIAHLLNLCHNHVDADNRLSYRSNKQNISTESKKQVVKCYGFCKEFKSIEIPNERGAYAINELFKRKTSRKTMFLMQLVNVHFCFKIE